MSVPSFPFATIFAPHSVEEFLQKIYGHRYLHLKGDSERFKSLLTWNDLNHLLRHPQLDAHRVRLAKAGARLPLDSLLSPPARRGAPVSRTIVPALVQQLREGATLIIDALNEAHRPVGDLTAAFELLLREEAQVNCYIGWGDVHGFDLHWDVHDVFVFQVAGRKKWQIYGETRKYPLQRDIAPNQEPPPTPIWEEVLESGDLLYLPRGWWHIAFPLHEPSIHLTLGVSKRNGTDLVHWLADSLRAVELARQDIPRFASREEKAQYVQALRMALLDQFDHSLVDRFLADHEQHAKLGPITSLPAVVEAEI